MSDSGQEPFEALFEQARGDALTRRELERLWKGVTTAGVGAGGALADLPPRPPAPTGWMSGGAIKIASVLVIAGGVGIAGFTAKSVRSRETAVRPPIPAQVAPSVAAPSVEGVNPPTVAWDDLPKIPESPPAVVRTPHARTAPVLVQGAETPDAVDEVTSAPAIPSPPPAEPGVRAVEPQPSEGALLLRARQSLTSDPASALALTDEDARRFPTGPLTPEREVLAVEALARLRRLPEARVRLAAFRSRYPQSPHLARLETLVNP